MMEIVKVVLDGGQKAGISVALKRQMAHMGFDSFKSMDMGFPISEIWPFLEDKPTICELAVIAEKLKCLVHITGIEIVPIPAEFLEPEHDSEAFKKWLEDAKTQEAAGAAVPFGGADEETAGGR
jgi:hypothetical protein